MVRQRNETTVVDIQAIRDSIEEIKKKACDVSGCESFAELAALAMARRFASCGRRLDAKRVLKAYLRRHQSTPRIEHALLATA